MKPEPVLHPAEERLLAHATGATDAPRRLLLEAHLALCAPCRRRVARFQAPGGLVLEAMPAAPLAPDLFARIWAEARRQGPRPEEGGVLPAALLAEVPPAGDLRWHTLPGSRSQVARLKRDAVSGSSLYLVRMEAGARFPHHTHRGAEELVVLAGGVWMGGRFLEAGDWSASPSGSQHGMRADAVEGCQALTRVERGDIQLSGWRGLLQRVAELRARH